jgi:hypothetical protein
MRRLAAALVLLALPAAAQQQGFRSPSGNIHCLFVPAEGFLRCDLLDSALPPPPQPAECDLDWGRAFGLAASGPAQRLCAGDTVAVPPGSTPVLAYGTAWVGGGLRCESRTDGMLCRNAMGHGFHLSRGRQTLF